MRESIPRIRNGPGCLQRYRSVWHTLQLRGKRVPRIVVQELLREIDPEGSELRKYIALRKENIKTLAKTMLGTVTGMINLSHMDSQLLAASTAGATRLCGYM